MPQAPSTREERSTQHCSTRGPSQAMWSEPKLISPLTASPSFPSRRPVPPRVPTPTAFSSLTVPPTPGLPPSWWRPGDARPSATAPAGVTEPNAGAPNVMTGGGAARPAVRSSARAPARRVAVPPGPAGLPAKVLNVPSGPVAQNVRELVLVPPPRANLRRGQTMVVGRAGPERAQDVLVRAGVQDDRG